MVISASHERLMVLVLPVVAVCCGCASPLRQAANTESAIHRLAVWRLERAAELFAREQEVRQVLSAERFADAIALCAVGSYAAAHDLLTQAIEQDLDIPGTGLLRAHLTHLLRREPPPGGICTYSTIPATPVVRSLVAIDHLRCIAERLQAHAQGECPIADQIDAVSLNRRRIEDLDHAMSDYVEALEITKRLPKHLDLAKLTADLRRGLEHARQSREALK